MRDYRKRYSGQAITRQRISGRRSERVAESGPSRVVGVVAVAALALGVCGSLWFGAALRDSLGRLDSERREKKQLASANQALLAEKEKLMAKESFVLSAEELGLFEPAENQLRKP